MRLEKIPLGSTWTYPPSVVSRNPTFAGQWTVVAKSSWSIVLQHGDHIQTSQTPEYVLEDMTRTDLDDIPDFRLVDETEMTS